MTPCPDRGQLIALSEALQWRPASRLTHVAACPSCQDELAAIEALGTIVDETVAPEAGFTDRVMEALPLQGGGALAGHPSGPHARAARATGSAATALTGLATAVGAFFGALFVGGAGGAPGPGLPLVLASLLAGVAMVAWDLKGRRAVERRAP